MTRTLYDMHSHAHEFEAGEIEEFLSSLGDLKIVAVSEDLDSFYKTMELANLYPEVIIPCAGLHPWNIGKVSLSEAEELARLAVRYGLRCIGEVGLDKRFVPKWTWQMQTHVFSLFLDVAAEIDAYVTVHSPNAWRDALLMLWKHGVRRVMFHWYTGPVSLIPVITSLGYFISINPAIKIQEKHKRTALNTPLENMVFESDGPYNYKGLRLTPVMIPEAIDIVARLKKVDTSTVWEQAALNSGRLLS